jgi:hypothetical protein
LVNLQRSLERGVSTKARVLTFATVIIGVILILGGYLGVAIGGMNPRIGVALAALGGVAIGIWAHLGECAKQWPILSACLDRERVERRLLELRSRSGAGV